MSWPHVDLEVETDVLEVGGLPKYLNWSVVRTQTQTTGATTMTTRTVARSGVVNLWQDQ